MTLGTEKIIELEPAWCKSCLPGYGISMTMILNCFEQYNVALKNKQPLAAYEEVQLYLASLIYH